MMVRSLLSLQRFVGWLLGSTPWQRSSGVASSRYVTNKMADQRIVGTQWHADQLDNVAPIGQDGAGQRSGPAGACVQADLVTQDQGAAFLAGMAEDNASPLREITLIGEERLSDPKARFRGKRPSGRPLTAGWNDAGMDKVPRLRDVFERRLLEEFYMGHRNIFPPHRPVGDLRHAVGGKGLDSAHMEPTSHWPDNLYLTHAE